MIFPRHDITLYLTHNQHRSYYQTIEEYVSDMNLDNWINEEEKTAALASQDFWELQWYPDTPIGSYCLLAHNLDNLLVYARSI